MIFLLLAACVSRMNTELAANTTAMLQIVDGSPSEAGSQMVAIEVAGPADALHRDPGYGCVDWYQYETGVATQSAAGLA